VQIVARTSGGEVRTKRTSVRQRRPESQRSTEDDRSTINRCWTAPRG
jgi:hypothetical protein